jgi:MFS family permease
MVAGDGSVRRLTPRLGCDNRPFVRFWAGQSVSLFGDQVTLIALPLVAILVVHAGAAEMGYLTAAGLAPNLLFALHAGAWVDRHGHRRRVMIAADLGRAALLASIPLAYALGVLSLPQLFVVSPAVGALSVLFSVSYSTLFVSLVPKARYVEATSLLNGSRAFAFVAGPSVGGLLVQTFAAPFALAVDALSFVASAVLLTSIAPREPPVADAAHSSAASGARYIRHSPVVRAALGATATINFFDFVFVALFMLFATKTLGVRPGTLGVVLGLGAIGGLVGAALTERVGRRVGIGRTFLAGCVVFPAALFLVPLASGPRWVVLGLLCAAEFCSGFGVMLLDISIGAIFAAVIPDTLRARVSGAYLLVNYGARPLGALAGGILGARIGLRPTLLIAALGGTLGFLWLLPSPLPRMRALPESPEEAPQDPG